MLEILPFQEKRKVVLVSRVENIRQKLDLDIPEDLIELSEKDPDTFTEEESVAVTYTSVYLELANHFYKEYPTFYKERVLNIPPEVFMYLTEEKLQALEVTSADSLRYQITQKSKLPRPMISDLAAFLAYTTSPYFVANRQDPIKLLLAFDAILILLTGLITIIEQYDVVPSRRYKILPKPYQKALKNIITSQKTLELIAKATNSKKGSKKRLRILHKRLGIYTKKKPPFVKQKKNASI
jgi:hypothetical protein